MADKKILSFSVGPVQSFISQARKTKDSFSGSKILSDIIDHVLLELQENQVILPERIVFPDMDIESKPNRFILILDRNINEEFIVENIEKIVRKKFIQMSEETYKGMFGEEPEPIGFREQINDFLEVNWIALDFNEDNYRGMYAELDSLMGAIKNTRIYNQIKYSGSEIGETGKKCTICGERNSLFYKKVPKKYMANSLNYKIINSSLMSKSEALCSVCFVKRYYKKDESFPSTAEISLMNVLSKAYNWKIGQDLFHNPYLNRIGNSAVDLLYEENINIEYIKENRMLSKELNSHEENELISNVAENAYKIRKGDACNGLKFSKYYGIISFDGDSMGEWLSGEEIDKNTSLRQYHSELSQYIGEFAKKASEIMDVPKGKIVYAGGEDFLGFVNCEYVFEIMKELRKLFDRIVNQPIKKYCKDKEKNLTFSAGICISHYKASLSNSIITTKEMEAKSKKIDGKNAFSMALLKRSGEIKEATYKWQDIGEESYGIIDNIISVMENLKNGCFSNNFIYSLGKELEMFADKKDDENIEQKGIIDEIIQSEIKRLVNRSANMSICDAGRINDMVYSLKNIYGKSNVEGNSMSSKENFMNLLYIITFLTKEVYYDNRN